MKRLHPLVALAAPAVLAAITLTSCSTPVPTFHVAGATPIGSRAIPGELQLFPGTYVFAANDASHASDLRWTVSHGTSVFDPGQTSDTATDGVASVSAAFTAAPNAKRYYQVCLSSIASSVPRSCQVYVVGGDDLWNGSWSANPQIAPVGIMATQAGGAPAITLYFVGHPATVDGELVSPFQSVLTNGTQELWVEWVSPGELELHHPGLVGPGIPDPLSLTRQT